MDDKAEILHRRLYKSPTRIAVTFSTYFNTLSMRAFLGRRGHMDHETRDENGEEDDKEEKCGKGGRQHLG